MTERAPLKVRFGGFELDEANARLVRGGQAVGLAPKPFELLCTLVRAAGSLITKHQLLDQVWGHQFVSDSVLKTAISEVRAALADDSRHPRYIETVSRRGYRFIAPVESNSAASTDGVRSPGHVRDAEARFVGRRDALERLRRAWEGARSGQRSIFWIAGEPGIGKSALIEQFMANLGGGACARGQCVERHGTGEPYLPVFEALGELCRKDQTLPGLLRAAAPTWLLQLPWLCTEEERERLRLELAGIGPERMLREMGEVLERYTAQQPLLLVTEDLHWSDRATLELIDYVARRRGSLRLMWVATYRLKDVVDLSHPANSIRRELRLHEMCEELLLDPFSEAEVAEFLENRAPTLAQDEDFVRAVHERSDGVPLFVESIVRQILAAHAAGATEDAVTLVRSSVPENLAGIIEHHISELGDAEREVLSAAAVCGMEFRVTTIAPATGRDAVTVEQTCEELARQRLWLIAARRNEGRQGAGHDYAFSHGLFRQLMYEAVAPLARARLHDKVAGALEAERAAGAAVAAAELATHYEIAGETVKALGHYAAAAEAAMVNRSPRECEALARHALTLLDRAAAGPERDGLELALQTLLGVSGMHVSGMGEDTRAAFERAYALLEANPAHPMRWRIVHGYTMVLSMRAEYREALAVAARAAAFMPPLDDAWSRRASVAVEAQALMMQGRSALALSRIENAEPWIGPLDAALAQSSAADPQLSLLAMQSLQLLHLGRVEQGRSQLQQAYASARRLRQPMALMVATWYDALFELRLQNVGRVAELARELRTLADEYALALGQTAWRWFHGWALARTGSPLEGFRWIREAHDANLRIGMLAGGSENLGYAAEALLLAGDLGGAQAQVDEAMMLVDGYGERIYLPQLLITTAAIARAGGRSEAAESAIRQAIVEAQAQQAPWLEMIALLALCESNLAGAADRSALAAVVDRLPEASATQAARRARRCLGAAAHA